MGPKVLLSNGPRELEDRGCDRCTSLPYQFGGLYDGGSPALLRLSVFALRGTQLRSSLEIFEEYLRPQSGLWIIPWLAARPADSPVRGSEPCPPPNGPSRIT
ncbi:hypothetical protein AMECASPLE_023239 [Ameca splendens]|uniref:Uncharacterized protein n=1 Tax=Ameca splendens TaxID=208324 RepID=A0ABV0ZPF7_9TELE